jgi:cell division protein FtsI/penicillin-binding protein 2
MDNLTTQQKQKIQMDKLFNSSEGVIKEWVAGFVGRPVNELFDVTTPSEPIIFYPSDKTDGKFMEFKLEVVPANYKANLGDDILEEKLVVDTIHFFVYSIRVVYGSIMKTSDRGPAHDVCMEWDSESMTFYPKYFPDIKKKRDYLNYVFGHMLNAKKDLAKDKVEEWDKDFAELSKDLAETTKAMEDEKIEEKIEEKSLEWSNYNRIGVVVRYLSKEEVSANVQAQVRPVSDQKYEDPPEEKNGLNKMEIMMESLRDILKDDSNVSLDNNSEDIGIEQGCESHSQSDESQSDDVPISIDASVVDLD